MKLAGIIPARYGSSRFPGKPLAKICGKPMIVHTLENASRSGIFDQLVVATDDRRIYEVVEKYGGTCVLTSPHTSSGTERCAEVLTKLSDHWDAIINIQGDEPLIGKEHIKTVADMLRDKASIATLAKKTDFDHEIKNPDIVKIVINQNNEALYFSRSSLPYLRNPEQHSSKTKPNYFKHIGIYGYQADIVNQIVELPTSQLELAENLEQLRWLDHGYTIKIGFTEEESKGIDNPEDLKDLEKSLKHS